MDTKPLFVAKLTPLKKPMIELTLPTPDLGMSLALKSDSFTEAKELASVLNTAIESIWPARREGGGPLQAEQEF